jgi:hypothetical protein
MSESLRKVCVWTTRHEPSKAQRRAIRHAGYNLVHMPIRLRRAESILKVIRELLQREPDLIVAAMPKPTLHFLAQISPCPVVIAKMDYRSGQPRWTGQWRRVIRVKLETQPFRLQ